MYPETPEEIWSHIFHFLTDVEHHDSTLEFKPFHLDSCNHELQPNEDSPRYLHMVHRHKSYRNTYLPSHILSVSMVSQAFRRLALPFLYREILVQFPCRCRLEDDYLTALRDFTEQVVLMPYPELVK